MGMLTKYRHCELSMNAKSTKFEKWSLSTVFLGFPIVDKGSSIQFPVA